MWRANDMRIRKTEETDLEKILQIYSHAREAMKKNGNPTQWGDTRPSEATIRKDIQDGNSYVVEENGRICGVFSFIIGEEPTYARIEQGQWKNDAPYGTIHRVASDGTEKGILLHCLEYCEQQISNIRIDTHNDNRIMQHLLEKAGYEKCGIIYVEDGSPRIAYQKV
jgi:RimJ/RimL family protein N-acetyltransferase